MDRDGQGDWVHAVFTRPDLLDGANSANLAC